MSGQSNNNQTNSKDGGEDDDLPIAAIVCLAVGAYVILVIAIIVIRHLLVSRGSCKSDCCGQDENGDCCNFCSKANEACPCCCSTNVDGCLSKLCGQRKKIPCIDILLCNCCGCTEGMCECCKCKCPNCTPCIPSCCTGPQSCSCRPSCTDCCGDDLDPNTCGFMCLEVKVRSPRRGGSMRNKDSDSNVRRSMSEPRQYNTHQPHKDAPYGNGDMKYQAPDTFEDGSIHNRIDTVSYPGVVGNTSVSRRSSSHSPRFSGSRTKLTPLNSSNNAIIVVDSQHSERQPRSAAKNNHVNFDQKQYDSIDSEVHHQRNLSNSLQLSTDLSEDSSKISMARQALNRGTSIERGNRKSTSRSRRSLRVGQRSQRFPDKLLVSAESLSSSLEMRTSNSFENKSLASSHSLPQPLSVVKRRPLPPLRNSVETLK